MVRIRKKNSIHVTTGSALGPLNGPDTLIVDKDAFLITDDPNAPAAWLINAWTITINGRVNAFGGGTSAVGINVDGSGNMFSLKVGATGLVSGGRVGVRINEEGTIINNGRIYGTFVAVEAHTDNGNVTFTNRGKIRCGITADPAVLVSGSGEFTLNNGGLISKSFSYAFVSGQSTLGSATVTNWGTMEGVVLLGGGDDTFINFKKVGSNVISGSVSQWIDLGGGTDTFYGGSKKEIVIGGGGGDLVELGGGNDRFQTNHDDGADSVNGGKGIDTYFISTVETDVVFVVNLHETEINESLAPCTAIEFPDPLGNPGLMILDEVIRFENVVGGYGRDNIYGSSVSNMLRGGIGDDNLHGLGGKDSLVGDPGADTFWFHALSESGVAANTRDIILDFIVGEDKIDLSEIDADTTVIDDQPFHLTANGGQGAFTGDPGELRVQKPKGLTIVLGDVNGDSKADFSIALKGHIALVDTDFAL